MNDKQIAAGAQPAADDPADQRKPEQEPSLKGTFASVLLLGAVIVLMWTGVFLLFIARN